jgi:hypothetical protein
VAADEDLGGGRGVEVAAVAEEEGSLAWPLLKWVFSGC